jgi:hypothetical protein
MFSSRKTSAPVAAGLAYDPQFNYVTTLLHGDGTNGAQNNTFVDSSTNAFTITRNGTPTQGSFTPYGTLWSNYFNGSTDYLTLGGQSTFAFGTNDFTIEGWYYFNNVTSEQEIFDFRPLSTQGAYPMAYVWTDSKLYYWVSSANQITSSITLSTGTWYYIAICRSGTSTKMFINGTQSGSTYIDTTNYLVGANRPALGVNSSFLNVFYNGYISNFRIVNGTAVYTSNFTVPTTPLTAITNTVLLTCQSNRFIDNSTNNYTLTLNGTTSIQRFNPFLPTSSQAYSTSVYGGSGYLNGSSDYLTTSSNSAFTFGVGAFTVEFWIYPTANFSNFASPFTTGTSTNDFVIDVQTTGLSLDVNNNAVIIATSSIPLTLNSWNHVAISRGTSGSTLYIFINGQIGASVTNSTSWTNTGNVTIGKQLSFYVPGYITDLRVVKGTQVYSSAFTPPTSQLTAITNTSLLLSMQNAGIYDNAMGTDELTGGSAQISTSVKKYGTGSLSFDGSTSYLQSQIGQNFIFYTGNWTIECWIYISSSVNNQTPYSIADSANQISIKFDASNNLIFYVYVNSTYIINGGTGSSSALSLNTWYHHAIVRNGTNISCYLNGVSTSSTTISSSVNINGQSINCIIGGETPTGRLFNGYIDDFRITKGYARYTSNFTPPTQALPNYGM